MATIEPGLEWPRPPPDDLLCWDDSSWSLLRSNCCGLEDNPLSSAQDQLRSSLGVTLPFFCFTLMYCPLGPLGHQFRCPTGLPTVMSISTISTQQPNFKDFCPSRTPIAILSNNSQSTTSTAKTSVRARTPNCDIPSHHPTKKTFSNQLFPMSTDVCSITETSDEIHSIKNKNKI